MIAAPDRPNHQNRTHLNFAASGRRSAFLIGLEVFRKESLYKRPARSKIRNPSASMPSENKKTFLAPKETGQIQQHTLNCLALHVSLPAHVSISHRVECRKFWSPYLKAKHHQTGSSFSPLASIQGSCSKSLFAVIPYAKREGRQAHDQPLGKCG